MGVAPAISTTEAIVTTAQDAQGPVGYYGPNDTGYMTLSVEAAAKTIKAATRLYSEGHYPHSNARLVPDDHPLAVALHHLGECHKQNCHHGNVEHDPEMFKPYVPSVENQTRWDRYPPGSTGEPA